MSRIQYDIDTIKHELDISEATECVHLTDWIENATGTFTPFEETVLQRTHEKWMQHGRTWNEEELKMWFLSDIFDVANVYEPKKIKTFFERKLATTVGNHALHVICDCLIAKPKGAGTPMNPYFFLQEFKPSKPTGDPEGQMLAAMAIAQVLNQDEYPIYGAWLVGNNWRFATLVEKTLCQSRQFNAENLNELHQIVFIVRRIKDLVLQRNL